MPDRMHIDLKCFTDLELELDKASIEIKRKVDRATLEVGVELAALAKAKASGHSKSIPPTIKVVASPMGGAVAIEAGKPGKPLARLYEQGNKGGRGRFKHPVFGHRSVWVEQKRYPFIKPMFNANRLRFREKLRVAGEQSLEPLEKGGGPA